MCKCDLSVREVYYFLWVNPQGQMHQRVTAVPILPSTADDIACFAVQAGALFVEYGPIKQRNTTNGTSKH